MTGVIKMPIAAKGSINDFRQLRDNLCPMPRQLRIYLGQVGRYQAFSVMTMMKWWSGKNFRITEHLWWKSGDRWFSSQHNDHDGVSNHQPRGCLLNRLFRRRSKKTSKLRVTGLCAGNSPGPVNSPHKGSVTRKMFPFDDVIMQCSHRTFKESVVRYYTQVPIYNMIFHTALQWLKRNIS